MKNSKQHDRANSSEPGASAFITKFGISNMRACCWQCRSGDVSAVRTIFVLEWKVCVHVFGWDSLSCHARMSVCVCVFSVRWLLESYFECLRWGSSTCANIRFNHPDQICDLERKRRILLPYATRPQTAPRSQAVPGPLWHASSPQQSSLYRGARGGDFLFIDSLSHKLWSSCLEEKVWVSSFLRPLFITVQNIFVQSIMFWRYYLS